jgi:hypothetical protein
MVMDRNLYNVEIGKEYIVTETPDIKLLNSIGILKAPELKRKTCTGSAGRFQCQYPLAK